MLIHRSSYALGSRHTHTHFTKNAKPFFFLMCHNKNLHKISCSFQFRIINFMPNNSLDLNLKGEHFILKYYRRKIPSEAEKVRPMLLKPMLSLSLSDMIWKQQTNPLKLNVKNALKLLAIFMLAN